MRNGSAYNSRTWRSGQLILTIKRVDRGASNGLVLPLLDTTYLKEEGFYAVDQQWLKMILSITDKKVQCPVSCINALNRESVGVYSRKFTLYGASFFLVRSSRFQSVRHWTMVASLNHSSATSFVGATRVQT